jgi:hypothetical protein
MKKQALVVLSAVGAKICVVPNEIAIKHGGCLSNDRAWDGRFRIGFVARQGRDGREPPLLGSAADHFNDAPYSKRESVIILKFLCATVTGRGQFHSSI